MKPTETVFVVFDNDGKRVGFFLGNEEELCRQYCKLYECNYSKEVVYL